MLTPREKNPLYRKMSPEEDRTRDAVDSEPKHYQLSYSGPFCFLIFYPIKVQGLHCQFSSLLQVLGEGLWWGGQVGSANVQLLIRQVRCGLEGQEVSEVLVPHHQPPPRWPSG